MKNTITNHSANHKWKSLSRLTAGLVWSLLFTGCDRPQPTLPTTHLAPPAQAPSASSPTEPQNLTCASLWPDRSWWQQTLAQRIDEFKFLHPNLQIKLSPELSESQEARRIADMILANDYPVDIVRMNTTIFSLVSRNLQDPEWAVKYLHNFFDNEDFVQLHRPKLIEWTKDRGRIGGIWPGPYLETKYACIWYNQALGQKMGITLTHRELRRQDLLKVAQKLALYNQTAEKKVDLFALCPRGKSPLRLFRRLYTSGLVDEHGNLGPRPLQTNQHESLKETLHFFEQLSYFDLFTPRKGITDQELFLEETVLFYPCYTDRYIRMTQLKGEEWMKRALLLESPKLKSPNFAFGEFEHSWAVMEKGPHKQLAIEFLKHIAKEQSRAEAIEGAKIQSGLRGSFFTPTKGKTAFNAYVDFKIHRYQDYIFEAHVETMRRWPWRWSKRRELAPPILENLNNILLNKLSAEEAYQNISAASIKAEELDSLPAP